MTQNDTFAETNGFAETWLKHLWLEMAPIVSKWMSRWLQMANWLEMARFVSKVVVPAGFEPMTHRLEICCSIQLSYGTIFNTSRGRQIRTADLHVPNVAR